MRWSKGKREGCCYGLIIEENIFDHQIETTKPSPDIIKFHTNTLHVSVLKHRYHIAGIHNLVSTTLLFNVSQYLQDVVGTEAISEIPDKHWPIAHQLPLFLQNLYDFYETTLFGHCCLLMLSISQEGAAPAVVRKHWQEVHKYYKGEILYIAETVSSYNRKRLIQQRVPFLIPGNQLYIPMLGIDLREYFKSAGQIESSFLGSATQAVLIREILHGDCSGLAAKELAHLMGYSPMTITRTINELTH